MDLGEEEEEEEKIEEEKQNGLSTVTDRSKLVTVRVFIYFLFDLPGAHIESEQQLQVRNLYENHCLWAEIYAPSNKKLLFKVKVGQAEENRFQWDRRDSYLSNIRVIESEDVVEGMLYVDFNNEKFDNCYRSNTEGFITSSKPFFESALFLARHCQPPKFEKEIHFLFHKMKQKIQHTPSLKIDLVEVFALLEKLSELNLIMKEDVFVKGLIICHICSKHGIEVIHKYCSLEAVKLALPYFERFPSYILMAKEQNLCGNGRGTEGMFYLVSTIALAFSKKDTKDNLRTFKQKAAGTFTEEEVQVLLTVDWKNCTLTPQDFCGSLAMALQINKFVEAISLLFGKDRQDYMNILRQMGVKEYLEEWKCCLRIQPFVNAETIPFSLLSDKLKDNQNVMDELLEELVQSPGTNNQHIWARHLTAEIQGRVKKQSKTHEQFILGLLGVLQKVERNEQLTLELHKALPRIADRSLIPRTKQLLKFTTTDSQLVVLEINVILEIVEGMTKEYLLGYYEFLFKNIEHPIVMTLYEPCWSRLVEAVIKEVNYSMQKQNLIRKTTRAANDFSDSDLFYCLFSDHVLELFNNAYGCGAVPSRLEVLEKDANLLVERINDFNILPEVIPVLAEKDVLTRLQELIPRDSVLEFTRLQKRYLDIRTQWANFLDSLNIMKGCEQFEQEVVAVLDKYAKEYRDLESKPVKLWTLPKCHPQLRTASEYLTVLKESRVFLYNWSNPKLGEMVTSGQNDLTERWVAYFEVYFQHWKSLVQQIGNGEATISVIEQLFQKTIHQLSSSFRNKLLHSTEAEVRQEMENLRKAAKEEVENVIEKEIQTAGKLTDLRLEKARVFQLVFDCIIALVMVDDVTALQMLFSYLKIDVLPALNSFCTLFQEEKTKTQTRYSILVTYYIELLHVFPNLRLLIQGFPSLFLNVMVKQDLFQVLSVFSDVAKLNSRIDSRQGEDIREETHDILHALRLLCDNRSILQHRVFGKLTSKSRISPEELLDFFVTCGGAVVALAMLDSKLRKGGIQIIKEALQSDCEEKQTITIVKNLLVNGGMFVIEVKDGKVSVSATYTDADRSQVVKISSEELEALPSQLLLTSGVTTKNQNVDEEYSPLPENIARLEDRERYVRRFTNFFDTMFHFSEVVKKLCHSGHPDYQEKTFSIACKLFLPELKENVKSRENLLLKWMNTFATCREEYPILSFMTRSQMVSCLSALRTQKTELLFSTLQSIGCSPQLMSKSLQSDIKEAKNINKAPALFYILSSCLGKYFDIGKLTKEYPEVANSPQLKSRVSQKNSHVSLLRVLHEQLEEVVCGAHISLHMRPPCPIEILFCTARTTETDIEDFLDRWALFTLTRRNNNMGDVKVSFWLIKVEELTYSTQVRCMQKLLKLVESVSKDHPKLFLVTQGSQRSYISTILNREETELNNETCLELSSLIRPIAAALKNIYVVHSSNCGAGKTSSVLRNLVCEKRDSRGEPVLHAQLSIDLTPIDVILKRLLKARPMTSNQGIVLHFNVGHQVNAEVVNLFLFQYLLVSSWRDSRGFTFARHEKDTIVVELCNTGKKDERERITICKYFQELPVDAGISCVKFHPVQSPYKLLYSFDADIESLLGTQMLIATFTAMQKGTYLLPFRSEICTINLVSDDELLVMVSSIACDNFCSQQHLMLTLNNATIAETLNCAKCKQAVSSQCGFVYCETCKCGLCHSCMRGLPVPRGSELLFVRRLFWFVVTQLQNFHSAFEQWDFAVFDEDGVLYQKLAYHFCRMILSCAKNLAKPAMEPYDERNPLDDVQRCEYMDKFENWRDIPFFLVTPGSYHVTSTSTFSPLQFIKIVEPRTPNNEVFHQWIAENEACLNPVNRSQLQEICSSLSERPYSVDQKSPPLKTLLEVLGCWSGAIYIINAIDSMTSGKSIGTKQLSEVISSVAPAFNFLHRIGKVNDTNITCTEFLSICTTFLKSLFGNPAEKPQYTLTADNILRLMAVQMRLISGIPVCIMGETGCGKTETLHFLSNISGKDFKVVNVQEGMMEKDFYRLMKGYIKEAQILPDRQIVVMLDEVNATSGLWVTKDLLCDHICFGVRIPSNIVFVVILNPWKVRTTKQQAAIAEMDVGGLDFLKYQQSANRTTKEHRVVAPNLVYQVHRCPETLYSLVWDWGSSSTTETPLSEIKQTFEGKLLVKQRDKITDELLMASSMVSWLIRKIENVPGLRNDFKKAGDGTEGEGFWLKFRTILVHLLLTSQEFLRHDVYLDEISVVSLRDMRKACELIELIFIEFWCEVRVKLQKEHLAIPFPYFKFLKNAVHVALVNTYCLRLDATRRLSYLVRLQTRWSDVRSFFSDIHPDFMPNPANLFASYDTCELYQSFNELATYIVEDLEIDSGIAVNQALKENTFGVLCAVCTKSTLFIVGRPGSTKSRTLELLVRATEDNRKIDSFLGNLGIVIQKHVIQCSPYTTAHHVHSNARRAAMAQIAADKLVNSKVRRINLIVLEEVGATVGSTRNPLMSLHSMIDYGVEIDGKTIRLPIIGVSNYRLDASKMGRGRVIYRGNPPVNDLELTARAILRGLGEVSNADWIQNFSLAFSENVLRNDEFTWYFGMRDFYATVSTIRILATPLERSLQLSQLIRTLRSEINSHITRWAVMINLRGFPDKEEELKLAEAMQNSFGLGSNVLAKWEWKSSEDADSVLLCDCCMRMQLYRAALNWQCEYPNEELTEAELTNLFRRSATPVIHESYCQYFEDTHNIRPAEVISYSLREITSRHVMIFTKANAALFLLFSMGLVRKDQCTVIFQASSSKDQTTTASELVNQMMHIKVCMREGKTLILVKSRHLYESLLDALNVHYTKDRSSDESDNLHKTMLSMAGVTQSVYVKPEFRCILLEDQEELQSSVLPPVINRASKTILTYASALTPMQNKIKNSILQKSRVFIDNTSTINLLQFLIPGLSEESIDSAVYTFSEVDEVIRRLCYCFSRKNLRRLSLKLIEGLDTPSLTPFVSSWNHNWKMNQCNISFEKLAEKALVQAKHLMVITEQLQLSASSLAQTFEKIFAIHDKTNEIVITPAQMTILNQATSADVSSALASLKKTKVEDNSSAMSIFILDTTSALQSVHLDSFMYATSSEDWEDHHHVVLIVVVADFTTSLRKKNGFSIVFDATWGQLFADEIIPRFVGASKLLRCSLVEELEKDVFLHETLKPELILALSLEKDNLTTLCQFLSNSASSVEYNMHTVNNLLTYDSPLRQAIIDAILENTKLAEVSFETWSKLAFQKAKISSDSLRATYLDYLGSYVVHVLLQLLGVLMQFDSLQLAENTIMNDLITNIIVSKDIAPPCDIDTCLNLMTNTSARSADVESNKGYFLFPKTSRTDLGKTTKVAFPLSPFIVTHIFNLGLNIEAITSFLNLVKLGTISQELLDKYIQDALCIGAGVASERISLLKKIVQIFHPAAFESIFNFHCFIAENSEWFKYVMKFSMEDFCQKSIDSFRGNTVDDLVQLGSVNGILPLSRVDIVCTVCRNSVDIDWRLIRAMAMIDAVEGRTEQESAHEREILRKLNERFRKSEVDGVISLFQEAPYHFIKYFFFELFSNKNGELERVIDKSLHLLANKNDLHALLDKNEGLQCGVAFLLRKAFAILFQLNEPANDRLCTSLTNFILAGMPHYALASHCAFDVISSEGILAQLDEAFIRKFEEQIPLFHFIRMGLVISILIEISDASNEDAVTYHDLINQLLQDNNEDIREMTLFVLRRLSSGGTIEIEKAITEVRGGKYPDIISKCPVIDDVSVALQRVSPLGCYPDFVSAVATLSEYARAKTNENLNRYKRLNVQGKLACVGTCCLSVAPQPIPNFSSEIYPVIIGELPAQAANVFQRLINNQELRNKSEGIRELVLNIAISIINNHKVVVFYQQIVEGILAEKAQLGRHRNIIEDMMTPKCPRCRQAFVDWQGCFSVRCTCGCSFCGHCLEDCGNDAHPHLMARHGSYYGSEDQWRRGFGVIASGNIRNYLQTISPDIKPLLEAELPRILTGNMFFVRADQILQVGAVRENNRIKDVPPVVRTFLEILSCGGYIWSRITNDRSEADPLGKLLAQLENLVQAVGDLLFPNSISNTSAFAWVHALIWKLSGLIAPLDRKSVEERVSMICRNYIDPLRLLGEFDQTCRSHHSDILSELQLTEKQLMQKEFNEASQRSLLCLSRTIFNFEHQFWSHLHANYDVYPVLNLLGENQLSISPESTNVTLELIGFLDQLQQAAKKKRITRVFASREGSFDQFIKEYGEPLSSSVKRFEENFLTIFRKVTRWECNDSIQNTFAHLLNGFPEDVKLECFLPQRRGVGILPMALWGGQSGDTSGGWVGLPIVQNRLFQIIHENAPRIAGSPYFLTEKEVISVDTNRITNLVAELFLVPGTQPRLSDDLPVAEKLCKYGAPRLASLPYIASELPEYEYFGLEGMLHLFASIQTRLEVEQKPKGEEGYRGFTTLPAQLAGAVKTLNDRAPHAADLIFSFCAAVLVQLNGNNGVIPNAVADVRNEMPLTEEQQKGKQTLFELPSALKNFLVDHIPAMMGLCWNIKNLHETANVPIDDQHEADIIAENFQSIVENPQYHRQIPAILASLRASGITHFSTEVSEKNANTPLMYFLTWITIPIIEQEEALAYKPPFYTNAKHFGHILREAERILRPHELSTPVLEDSCLIPFSAVRQFLQSHIIEQQPKPLTPNPLPKPSSFDNLNPPPQHRHHQQQQQQQRQHQPPAGHILVSSTDTIPDLEL